MESRKNQSEILQKFKESTEEYVPNLNTALRRAAATGNSEDIALLIKFGANINSQDENNGHTALHVAVLHSNADNARFLLLKGARKTIFDQTGMRICDYVSQKESPELFSLIGVHSHQIFSMNEIIVNILSSLPFSELQKMSTVSFIWSLCVNQLIQIRLMTTGITQYKTLIEKIAPEIRVFIYQKIFDNEVESVSSLLAILEKNAQKRKTIHYTKSELPWFDVGGDVLVSDIIVTLIHFKLLHKEDLVNEFRNAEKFNNKYLFIALSSGLITREQLKKFKHSGSTRGPHDNLSNLFTLNGLKALKDNLITVDDAPYISDLKSLLSDTGLILLREGLISSEQSKALYHSGSINGPFCNLRYICTKNGLAVLRNKHMTLEQIAYISFSNNGISDSLLLLLNENYISFIHLPGKKIKSAENIIACASDLASSFGISVLRRKMFNQAQLESLSSARLKIVFTPQCIELIDKKILSIKAILAIQDLKNLISPEGIAALKVGIITIQQAIQLKSLAFVHIPGAIAAIKEGLISPEDFPKFRCYGEVFQPRSLTALFGEYGLLALREKLITINDATTFYHSGQVEGKHDNLSDLLTPLGIQALRENLIKPSEASCYALDKLFKPGTPRIILALKLGLVQLKDFKYGGRFYYKSDHEIKMEIEAAVPEVILEKGEEISGCVVLQKYIRTYQARRKLGLFNELSERMRTGNIHQLGLLSQVKGLIDDNKLDKANDLLCKYK